MWWINVYLFGSHTFRKHAYPLTRRYLFCWYWANGETGKIVEEFLQRTSTAHAYSNYRGRRATKEHLEKRSGELTSTKGTMDPEGSARNSCNSWPFYATFLQMFYFTRNHGLRFASVTKCLVIVNIWSWPWRTPRTGRDPVTRGSAVDCPRTCTCPPAPCSCPCPCGSCRSWPTWAEICLTSVSVCLTFCPGSCGRCSAHPWNDCSRFPFSPHTTLSTCPAQVSDWHRLTVDQ